MNKQNTSFLNKGISTPIGILVIVLTAIIAGAGIFAYQYYWPLEEEVEIPKDETANWEIYNNNKYGYELKYLSGFEIFEKEQGGYIEIGSVLVNFSIKIKENLSSLEELKSLEEEILKNTGLSDSDLKISWKDKTFLGLPAKELSFKGFAGGEPMIRRTYVIKDNNAYILSSGNAENFDEYYRMLSTFKFVEKKTYIDVIYPKPNQLISSPFQIKGEISVFEEVMDKKAFIKLTDNNNHKLFPIMGRFETKSYLSITDTKASFSLDVSYVQPTSKKGTIKIFVYIPTEDFEKSEGVLESWSPKTLVEIPIIFDEDLLTIPNNWNIYSNPEAKFTFRYPKDWDIISEYFYETPAGFKSEEMTVTLGKEEKGGISINLRQAMCSPPCWCREVKDNIIQTCPKDSEALEVFNKVVSTFKVLD